MTYSLLKNVAASLAVLLGSVTGGSVSAQDTDSFALLPSNGAGIAATGSFDLGYTENGGALSFGLFSPLRKYSQDNAWLLFHLGVDSAFDEDLDANTYSGFGGLVYRQQFDENTIWGLNAYLEGGRASELDDFMGLASLGAELDYQIPDSSLTLQGGGNIYIPFDDYTDPTEYGLLGAAPRKGADAYVSLSRSFENFDLRGTLSLFDYAETDTALGLSGYQVGTEFAFGGDNGAPEFVVSLGARDDNRAFVDPALVAGVAVNFTFGGTNDVLPARDCAISRDGENNPVFDCNDQVIATADGVTNKVGAVTSEEVAPPRVRVAPPRRHIAFGTPFTPIEYKEGSITLVKVAEGEDGTFSFVGSDRSLNTKITTSRGTGTAVAVAVVAGTYTITETDLPAGFSFASARCVGATATAATQQGVVVTVGPAQDVICTFRNVYSSSDTLSEDETSDTPDLPPVAEIATLQLVKLAENGNDTFTFETGLTGLPTSLTTVEGTAQSEIVEVPAGTYTLSEVQLPDGWEFVDAACTGATDSTTGNSSVDVTLAAGDAAICTFENRYVEPDNPGGEGCRPRVELTNGYDFGVNVTVGYFFNDDPNDFNDYVLTSTAGGVNAPPTLSGPANETEIGLCDLANRQVFMAIAVSPIDQGDEFDESSPISCDIFEGDQLVGTLISQSQGPSRSRASTGSRYSGAPGLPENTLIQCTINPRD